MPTDEEWKSARKLNPIQMMAWAITIAHHEAQERGEMSEELADKLAERADEIAVGLLQGKAIMMDPKTRMYVWLERPKELETEQPEAPKDVLVINPK